MSPGLEASMLTIVPCRPPPVFTMIPLIALTYHFNFRGRRVILDTPGDGSRGEPRTDGPHVRRHRGLADRRPPRRPGSAGRWKVRMGQLQGHLSGRTDQRSAVP